MRKIIELAFTLIAVLDKLIGGNEQTRILRAMIPAAIGIVIPFYGLIFIPGVMGHMQIVRATQTFLAEHQILMIILIVVVCVPLYRGLWLVGRKQLGLGSPRDE